MSAEYLREYERDTFMSEAAGLDVMGVSPQLFRHLPRHPVPGGTGPAPGFGL
jgi:hypothetical protein